jgi:hypothetical protein
MPIREPVVLGAMCWLVFGGRDVTSRFALYGADQA